MQVLYLHGFASSPTGRKVTALREALASTGGRVEAPDLNVPDFRSLDFDAMVETAAASAAAHPPDVVVGSSLGAIVALAFAKEHPVPLVLVAPALGFGPRWTAKLPPGDPVPFFHHGEGAERPIHRAFFERMACLEVDRAPPPSKVAVVMGTDDESVPFAVVRETWELWERSGRLAAGSTFVEIAGGDHSLVEEVPRIAELVRLNARRRESGTDSASPAS